MNIEGKPLRFRDIKSLFPMFSYISGPLGVHLSTSCALATAGQILLVLSMLLSNFE